MALAQTSCVLLLVLTAAMMHSATSQSYCYNNYGSSVYCQFGCCGSYTYNPCCGSYPYYNDYYGGYGRNFNASSMVAYIATGVASGTALLIGIIISTTLCCIYGCCKKSGKVSPQIRLVGGSGAPGVLQV